MKCKNYKKMVYLYDVLDEPEKRALERHVDSCHACQHDFKNVRDMKERLKGVSPARASVAVRPASVNLIMREIGEAELGPNVVQSVYAFMQIRPMRYALAVISAGMVMLFVSEVNRGSITNNNRFDKGATVQLTRDMFNQQSRRAVLHRQPLHIGSKLSFYGCITACKDKTHRACADCKKCYSKIRSYGI